MSLYRMRCASERGAFKRCLDAMLPKVVMLSSGFKKWLQGHKEEESCSRTFISLILEEICMFVERYPMIFFSL